MVSTEAQRTLVKSPPELWAELSDPASLARHLGELGEIRIVSVEPESKVQWEGEGVSGAVELKASGWGTKVTLTASREIPEPEPEPAVEPEPVAEPEPTSEPAAEQEPTAEPRAEQEPTVEPAAGPEPDPRPGFFARLFRRRRKSRADSEPVVSEPPVEVAPEPTVRAEPEPAVEPEPEPDLAAELAALEESLTAETTAVLTAVLDRLGAAHHRPFSRA